MTTQNTTSKPKSAAELNRIIAERRNQPVSQTPPQTTRAGALVSFRRIVS